MSLIGSKQPRAKRGFTLVEVMVATAILSLGLVMIYQAFLISLDSFGYSLNHLQAQLWLDEMAWQIQDNFRRYEFFSPARTSGEFIAGNKDFSWKIDYEPIQSEELYSINLSTSWQQGSRMINLSRAVYVSNFVEQ
jgi:prepilin-type N-terminal cleavage/methylation domain-containing protein